MKGASYTRCRISLRCNRKKKITIGNIWVLLWILLEPERFTQTVISHTITFASGLQTAVPINVFRFCRGLGGVSFVWLFFGFFKQNLKITDLFS